MNIGDFLFLVLMEKLVWVSINFNFLFYYLFIMYSNEFIFMIE